MATTAYKPSPGTYNALVAGFIMYSLFVGYYVATLSGSWQSPFSWHPFLMTFGMIGSTGTGAITKKLGGYSNTKTHGILSMLGVIISLGGMYAIYHNKNLYEKPHFTSNHGKAGLGVMCCSVGAGMAGAVFLHPDFGIDKGNKTIRLVHKTFARVVLGCAWVTAFVGLCSITDEPVVRALYALPLLVFAPFTLW